MPIHLRGEQEVMNRVLLAENHDAVRSMLEAALVRDGFEVAAVANVSDALSHITTQTFDLLVSEAHMPTAGEGFTVVSAMRHMHPHAIILVLSDYPATDRALAAFRAHADEVLTKPVSLACFSDAIRNKLTSPTACRKKVTGAACGDASLVPRGGH
jgi:DNA-binding NtrC family response regulator